MNKTGGDDPEIDVQELCLSVGGQGAPGHGLPYETSCLQFPALGTRALLAAEHQLFWPR